MHNIDTQTHDIERKFIVELKEINCVLKTIRHHRFYGVIVVKFKLPDNMFRL